MSVHSRIPTKPCGRCRWPYPDDGLHMSSLVSGDGHGRVTREDMCAICALEETNKAHGTKRKAFHGDQAEFTRQECLAWRRRHPELRP